MTDKQQPGFASLKQRFFKQESTRPHLRSQTEEIKGGGKVFVKHSQHSKNCLRRGSASNLSGVVRKPHVPSSMAYILYALFTLLILTRLISPHQISTCCQKKENPPGWYRVSHSLSRYLCFFPPCITSLFFVFLLEFLICKREKMRSCHSLMRCSISLQRVARYYKGTGRRPCYAALRCAVLCAMLCMLNVVAIMKM